jgi:hypothetical protein
MTHPAGRSCELESVRVCDSGDTVSLLFSCTRVLVIPEGQPHNFQDLFLARIPVVVRVLFRTQLIEISMPPFSEPAGLYPSTPSKVPERYQVVIQSGQAQLIGVVPYSPRGVSYRNITLYLETCLKAVDMGWRIEPSNETVFDLTQGLIPLREILDSFSQSLAKECADRKIDDPLSRINLYHVFRALKDQSHTYSLILRAPIGQRGGNVLLSTLYGPRNSGYVPLLLLGKTNAGIMKHLREAVNQSQITGVENPYDLSTLFAARGATP